MHSGERHCGDRDAVKQEKPDDGLLLFRDFQAHTVKTLKKFTIRVRYVANVAS
jgi:hypothetical protein